MKTSFHSLFFKSLLVLGSVCATPLSADIDDASVGSEEISPTDNGLEGKPFTFDATYDWVGRCRFDKRGHRHQHVRFNTGHAEIGSILCYNPCYQEGLQGNVAYSRTHMEWRENPYFDQDNWNTLTFSLRGFSKRAHGWLWLGEIAMNIDADQWNFSEYTTWDLFAWGRYDYCQDVGVHIGIIAETGMKIDRAWPILGFDWQYNEDWKFSLVYPMNISAVYTINPSWSAEIAARFFDTRHRANKHEKKPRSLFSYRSSGLEAGINYEYNSWLSANGHAGYLLGGTLKIADRHWHHGKRLTFDGAPYVGGEVKVHF